MVAIDRYLSHIDSRIENLSLLIDEDASVFDDWNVKRDNKWVTEYRLAMNTDNGLQWITITDAGLIWTLGMYTEKEGMVLWHIESSMRPTSTMKKLISWLTEENAKCQQ